MRRKYSNALRSFCATPSPSAYMRPSFHCASAWPFSAAYSSELTAFTVSPALSQCAPERNASTGVIGGGPMLLSVLLPSSAKAGAAAIRPAPISNTRNKASTVRIALFLSRAAGMRHRAIDGGADLLGVFPQIAGSEFALARRPRILAFRKLIGGKLHVERALHRIDLDDVAVADQPDRPADRGFRSDMADAEAARCAGETPVGDERDFFAVALAVERGRRRQHFAHAGAAARPFVADDQDVAVLVLPVLDRVEAGFLAIEAARRSTKLQRLHSCDLHDRAVGCEITSEPDHAPGGQQRLVGRAHHVLIRIPFNALQIFRNRAAGDREAITVQEAVIEERLHEEGHTASFEHILGDITAARFQICDIRCLFEDFGDVEQRELDTALVRDRRQMQR